jgi:vacuolar-type H+-ATPase subunit D/Vma8
VKKTTFSLHNRGDKPVTVYVRHAVLPGWTLKPTAFPMERLSGTHLFPVKVAARGAVEVSLEETQPVQRTIDLRTTTGADSVGLYLKSGTTIPEPLRKQLEEVLALYREMANVEQKLSTLGEQMNEYRTRVDELNEQLVTLRKVERAQDLSRHLAKKMQEISDRLQKATIESADLQGELMTRRIRVQDRLAELTLRPESPKRTQLAEK